jgi:hypothetical protein
VYDVELNYHYVSKKAGAAQLTSTVQLTTKGSRFRCAAFKPKSGFCVSWPSPFKGLSHEIDFNNVDEN